MNNATLKLVAEELDRELTGGRFGRVLLLSKSEMAIDFRLRDGRFLLISADPRSPRLYLLRSRLRDLEKQSLPETAFTADLRKTLSGADVLSVSKLETDRVVMVRMRTVSEFDGESAPTLVVQLTGRSSNIFRLDDDGRIAASMKPGNGEGQEAGHAYRPPEMPGSAADGKAFDLSGYGSISEALAAHFTEADEANRLRSAFRAAESRQKATLKKLRRLAEALEGDLANHGDPERWKKYGDLLLANAATATRNDDGFVVIDYFSDDAPELLIEADPRHSVSEAAEAYFKKYSKARNAGEAIANRLKEVGAEIDEAEARLAELKEAFERGDSSAFEPPAERAPKKGRGGKRAEASALAGIRKFESRDGFEILVGKKSKDNDYLTFRVAGSLDTWLHAADYPGSHVVIRNPGRKEIPPTTLADAARLAAFYSKARGESKAAVHYTLRKFVHKPKGARPGLVSLADFKTIMVEPGVPGDD